MNKILLFSDVTETSENIFEFGFEMARKLDAEVELLTIIDEKTELMPSDISMDPSLQWEVMISQAKSRLESIKTSHHGLTVNKTVFVGDPHSDIFSYAIEHQINLIMLSTHGRTGLAHAMMGSMAEYIVRHSPIPVLVLPLKNFIH